MVVLVRRGVNFGLRANFGIGLGRRWLSDGGGKAKWALVVNAGSSSLKYALYSVERPSGLAIHPADLTAKVESACMSTSQLRAVKLASGTITEIGGQSVVTHKKRIGAENVTLSSVAHMPNFSAAFTEMIRNLTDPKGGLVKNPSDISVVGHRVVHGADSFNSAVVVNQAVENAIDDASRLAPLHNPANLIGIREAKQLFTCPHVAVFDTAFHSTIPKENYTYALPLDLAAKHKIRRYGFHGTSYCFVLKQTAEKLGKNISDVNAIICHLGNGASMACVEGGICKDTTMGLTPLEGLVMGTRSGDLDPGVYTHLTREQGMTPSEVDALLNKRSGLFGLCGMSDMQKILEAADAGEPNAKLAIQIFIKRIRKYLGSFILELKGNVDAIVFTAGIGENSERIRSLVCEDLQLLGISLDEGKNAIRSHSAHIISSAHSHTKILVVPTDEELAIALQSVEASKVMPVSDAFHAGKGKQRVGVGAEAEKAPVADQVAETQIEDSVPHVMDEAPGVYIAASNRSPMSDSSVPEVGLMFALEPQVKSVGYFRPIAYNEQDRRIDLIKKTFHIEDRTDDMYGVTLRRATKMLSHNEEDELISNIMDKFENCRNKHDFVIVSGLNQHEMPPGASLLNIKLADALNLPMIWSTDAAAFPHPGASRVMTVTEEIEIVRPKEAFKHVPLAGVIATEVPKERLASISERLASNFEELGIKTLAVMPSDSRIRMRTLREVANVLGAEVLTGHEMLDTNHVGRMMVGTLQVADLLGLISNSQSENIAAPVVSSFGSLSQQEMDDSRQEFERFDKYGDGTVYISEISNVMRALGHDANQTEVEMLLSENQELADVDRINFDQFLGLMSGQSVKHDVLPQGSILVVTHIGRIDLLLSLLYASKSQRFPKVAGILLTDGSKKSLPTEVLSIITSKDSERVPVLTIGLDTYEATQRIHGLHGLAPRLLPTSIIKLRAAQEIFATNVCQDFLQAIVRGKDIRHEMTSRHFQHFIAHVAKTNLCHIVLPEGDDPRVVEAAAELLDRKMCRLTILGDRSTVLSLASDRHVDLTGAQIIDPPRAEDFEQFVEELVRLRSKKGMTEAKARALLTEDFTWYGTLMMHLGMADGMVSGACHTTADTMRPALQIIKTAPGTTLVSSVMFMLLQDRVYLFGDCAINVDPNSDELCQIAMSCADTASAFGIEPRVAMLSYATGQSNTGPIVDKVRQATEKARSLSPSLLIEGPTQFDAAVDMEVAAVKNKGKDSPVLGKATVCVFPDLNTGNNTYKAVQQAARCIAVGPIMQGLRLPVNDLSRGCTIQDIVNTVIITCNQAKQARQALSKAS